MIGHQYTSEERQFFLDFIPGHTYKEIQSEFIKQFGWEISISQIKGYMGNHKINNGLTGKFKKGRPAPNKGQKMSLGMYEKCKATMFRKGHIPANHRPVGSERINVCGYTEVKIKEPKTWRLKHQIVWEEHHGPIPKGKIVIFLNGNKQDIRIDNLALIDKKVNVRLNQNGMRYEEPEITRAAIAVAELMAATGEAKWREKKCMTNT